MEAWGDSGEDRVAGSVGRAREFSTKADGIQVKLSPQPHHQTRAAVEVTAAKLELRDRRPSVRPWQAEEMT